MDKALRYLSLAAKAGKLLVGSKDAARCAKPGRGWLMVISSDASANTLREAQQWARRRGVAWLESTYTKSEIAHATGRSGPIAVTVICDKDLAKAFAQATGKPSEEEERMYEPNQISRA